MTEASAVGGVIELAREVQAVWASRGYRERARIVSRLSGLIESQLDSIVDIVSSETGKTRMDALATEALPAAMAVRWYCRNGAAILKERRVRGGSLLTIHKRSRIFRLPYGVVGVISPWNYPFSIPFSEVVMALLAGNAVILKVASLTPRSGRLIVRLFIEAGLPSGLFNLVELRGEEAGKAFIEGGVDKLFFTGSTEVGRELMRLASARVLPLVLELGGNDAAIVREDADLKLTVEGLLWAGFSNAGQSCGGVQRVFVHQSVWDEFCGLLRLRVQELRSGARTDPNTDISSLIHQNQKSLVENQLSACLNKGARVLATGQKPAGSSDLAAENDRWTPPTVLTELSPGDPFFEEEIFGPVFGVAPYRSDEDAVELANKTPWGLSASVWSKNRGAAQNLAGRLRAGAVTVNDHLMSHGLAETPWGGLGLSGMGRTHGEAGLLEMVRTQVVVHDLLPGRKRNLWWYPYSAEVYRGLRSALSLFFATKLRKRLTALPGAIRIFLRYWERP